MLPHPFLHSEEAAARQTRGSSAALDRRRLLAGALGGATAGALGVLGAAARPGWASTRDAAQHTPGRRPNVVVILADDLGYGATGPYGQQHLHTPHLDRMAQEGIAFTDVYSGAPICAPSRCSLLTGMHTGHARVRDNSFTTTGTEPELLPEDITFAEVLKAAGYTTGMFGKWGFGPDDAYKPLGQGVDCDGAEPDAGGPVGDLAANVGHPSHPLQKGFDEFVGMVRHHHASEGYWPSYIWRDNERVLLPENAGDARGTYAPDLYVEEALEFIERNRRRPFCIYLAPQLVHWPEHVPDTAAYDDRPWTVEQKRYAAQHTKLDDYVGMVLSTLRRLGLADHTLVLFTSDNGPTLERAVVGSGACTDVLGPAPDAALADKMWDTTGGLRAEKHSLYEGGIRVPMLAWGPGIVRSDPGAVAARPWSFPDLLPTLADFAGITAPSDVDGTSIRSWITGEAGPEVEHPPLYWERPPYMGLNADGSKPAALTYAQAARAGTWKGVRNPPGTDPTVPDEQWLFELYDLQNDPSERVNLAAAFPQVRQRLEEVMNDSHAPAPYARAPYRPQRTGTAWVDTGAGTAS